MLKLSDFDYALPKELIAQYPLKERDAARLLVLNRKDSTIKHRIFQNIIDYLGKDDLLVLNNTKVLPSRLKGRRLTQGKVEFLLLNRKDGLTFNTLIKPSRIKIGEKIILNGSKSYAIVSARNEVTFPAQDINAVYKLGQMPLPPYIKREPERLDNIYYQTVYAQREGAVASPSAGLHFTKELMNKIISCGTNLAYITLHISYSTFRPVRVDDITKHKMEEEYFKIYDDTVRLIDQTRQSKGRIFAVGTTSLRALETYASGKGEGYTDLFIYPGYKFKLVDCLLTNFHLPRTTLFMLVCAFCAAGASSAAGGSAYGRASNRAGLELAKKAYQEAIAKKYRFYSYGDAMLII